MRTTTIHSLTANPRRISYGDTRQIYVTPQRIRRRYLRARPVVVKRAIVLPNQPEVPPRSRFARFAREELATLVIVLATMFVIARPDLLLPALSLASLVTCGVLLWNDRRPGGNGRNPSHQ